jgi:predicted transcriptional regulator
MMPITSVRLSEDLAEQLADLADKLHRSKSWLISEAVKDFIARANDDTRRWQETLEALDAVQAGHVIDGDRVDAWLSRWGSDDETPPPQ